MMDLPLELRREIADRIIRVVAPVGMLGMVLGGIGVMLFGGQQYHRLVPIAVLLVLVIPSWFYTIKGKPLIGIFFLIACNCLGIIAGMAANGGIHAISYMGTLVTITIFTVIYGLRGGVAFAVFTFTLGGLSTVLIKYGVLHRVAEPTALFLFVFHGILLIMQLIFVLIPVRLTMKALMDSQQKSLEVNRLAAVVEQAAEDVLITDQNGIIQYVNPSFVEVTGYSPSEVIGKTPRIFKSGRQDDVLYKELWGTITKGNIWKGRIWNKIKNGNLILQDVTISPIFDALKNLTGYASVRRDITEQSRIEEKLRQAQKMEAIGTLAGGIAHDFNNILSGIIGYTTLALEDPDDRSSTKKRLERVLEAGGRATELVRQILSFSRSHKSEVKPIRPSMITKEVLKLMRASLPSTIEIKQSICSDSYIHADAINIHQLLLNLCTNAAHALKQKGGVLSVSLQDVTLGPEDLAHHPDVCPGEYLRISVEDTGIGMAQDVREKAFDPFFTTKDLGEGTGMGLSSVHEIVTRLSGFVSLYSEPDQGTTMHIFLPLSPKPDEINPSTESAMIKDGTERILFIDDEKIQIDIARDGLTRYGYHVSAFTDSTIALSHFQQDPDYYDLVITDMTMPGMSGDILTQKIHLKRPDIPIIMCTGFSEIIDEKKAEALGIRAFLYKPVIMAKLLETIRKVLDVNIERPTSNLE